MQMEQFKNFGCVVALLVLLTGFLMAIKVVPFTEVSVGLSIVGLSVAVLGLARP